MMSEMALRLGARRRGRPRFIRFPGGRRIDGRVRASTYFNRPGQGGPALRASWARELYYGIWPRGDPTAPWPNGRWGTRGVNRRATRTRTPDPPSRPCVRPLAGIGLGELALGLGSFVRGRSRRVRRDSPGDR